MKGKRVGIIGGGVIGLSIAWQLLRAGASVTLYEKGRAGEGTSRVAAGMLAPEAEVTFGEEELMKLGQKSLALYDSFIEELKEDAVNTPELDRCGTILVGKDRDDAEHLKRIFEFRKELGLDVEWWGGVRAREELELLSPRVSSAIKLPQDAQIDNRKLLQALLEAIEKKGGTVREGTEVKGSGRNGEELWLQTGEGTHAFDELVLAAGAWSGGVDQQESSLHPIKGQILTLGELEGGDLNCMVRSPRVYLVPKADGSIRVGGTSEEMGFDTSPTAGAVLDLLEEAWEVLPAVHEAPFQEVEAGLRPAHRDHLPRIGRGRDGIIRATGHYRHGILLAPLTAYSVRGLLDEGAEEMELPKAVHPSEKE